MPTPTLQIEHVIASPLEQVWQAWTDRERLSCWDPDRVEGEIVPGQTIVMHWDSFGVSIHVEVVSATHQAELRLRVRKPDGTSQDLIINLKARAPDKTSVELSFTGLMSEDEQAGTAAGWHTQLRLLDRFLAQPLGQQRESFAALGPAVTSVERAYAAFVEPASWLARDPIRFLAEGQGFALTTVDGMSLTGDVLSLVEGRELALWCDELNGVMRMRTIPLAGGRARLLGIQVVRWGHRESAHLIQESLRESVDRLIHLIGGPVGSA